VVERNFKASLMMQSAKPFDHLMQSEEEDKNMATATFIGEPLVVFENKIQSSQMPDAID
jgi:hypothetical protein